jgi:hypothetical protein
MNPQDEKETTMAERHRSKDGVKETEKYISEADDIDHQGRSGGGLKRDVGTQDEEKRWSTNPALTPASLAKTNATTEKTHDQD